MLIDHDKFMKKNRSWLIFFVALVSAVLYACWDDRVEVEQENLASPLVLFSGNESQDVLKAKEWYDMHEEQVFLSRSGEVRENLLFSEVNPVWSAAFVTYDGEYDLRAVEVPVASFERKLFALEDNAMAYEQTSDSRYIRSLTFLVICMNMKNGETTGFFMTQVPSKEYLEKTKFKAYLSTYLKRADDFDGEIFFHTMNGEFINGWRYSNGKITHQLFPDDSMLSRGGYYVTQRKCVPVYIEIYTDLYYTTETGGEMSEPIYNGTITSTEYIGDDCYYERYWVEDNENPTPGGGGGGSVGYPGTDPTDPPGIEKEIEPRKIDCSDVGVHASQDARDIWKDLIDNGLQKRFIDSFCQDDKEHGLYLLKNKSTGKYSLSSTFHGSSNSVVINYQLYEDEEIVLFVHNHPKSSQPSFKDVYALSSNCKKYEGRVRHSVVIGKNETVFDLQVVDTAKANAFFRGYSLRNRQGKDSLNMAKLDVLNVELSLVSNLIQRTSEVEVGREEESIAEWMHFAFAHLLAKKQTGMILVRRKKGEEEFKMLSGEEVKYVYGKNKQDTLTVVYRQICR